MKYKPKKTECGYQGCMNPRRPGQRRCHACHAKDSRQYRVDRVMVKRSEVAQARLPKSIVAAIEESQTYAQLMKSLKRTVLLKAVGVERGNLSCAARRLSVHRNTVNRVMREVGLRTSDVRQYIEQQGVSA